MGRREELLRAEAEGWDELTGLLDTVPPDLLERPGMNDEGWAVRDLVWHVAYWCADAARALAEIRAGAFDGDLEPRGPEQIDAINDREFGRSQRMDAHSVRAELHRSRAAMLDGFGALGTFTAEAEGWFDESGPLHYAEHLPELRSWAAKLQH